MYMKYLCAHPLMWPTDWVRRVYVEFKQRELALIISTYPQVDRGVTKVLSVWYMQTPLIHSKQNAGIKCRPWGTVHRRNARFMALILFHNRLPGLHIVNNSQSHWLHHALSQAGVSDLVLQSLSLYAATPVTLSSSWNNLSCTKFKQPGISTASFSPGQHHLKSILPQCPYGSFERH